MIKAFVENGRLAALFIAILLVAGLAALSALPRMEDPQLTSRYASVITNYPGASAERVESLVTEVLETQLRRLEELKLIQSTSRPGISVIQLELKDDVYDTEPVWSRARDLLADSQASLPNAAQKPTLDDQIGYANTVILGLVWRGGGEPRTDVLGRYAKELQSRLQLLPGTDFVHITGAPTEEILVELNGSKINQLQLTPADIARILSDADSKISAGEIHHAQFRALVEVSGELDSQQRIRQVPLKVDASGQIIRLGDVASVSRQPKMPPDDVALLKGEQGVMISARMLENSRIDKWVADVRASVSGLEASLPSNIELQWLFSQESYTTTRLGELAVNLLQGFVLILVVLMLTLGTRNALIVALSLPLTALFTLACMRAVDLPIHQMSVTGLVVALGIMVDNAIVIVDAISSRRQEGQGRVEAVLATIKHLWLPLAGSTLTTILAFAPIMLMPGAAGEFVGGIAITVMLALVGSYLISHTLIAGLAGRFSPSTAGHDWRAHGIRMPRLASAFERTLTWVLKRPLKSAILIGLLPLLGFIAAGRMTEQFFPPSDRDMFQIEVYLASQASLERSLSTIEAMDKLLEQTDGIERIDWAVGGNIPSFYYNITQRQQGAANYAQAMVKTSDFESANKLIPMLQQQLDKDFPEAQVLVRKLEQGPPFNAPIELLIYGPNLDELHRLGDEVRAVLAGNDKVTQTRATLSAGAPKIKLAVDEDASLMSGLTLSDIANQVQMATTGRDGGSIIEQTESLPVRVRLDDSMREHQGRLAALELVSKEATGIPLSALSEAEISVSRGAIPRRNGQRLNTIEAYIQTGVLPAEVLAQVKDEIAALPLPPGYHIEIGGESAKRNEAVGNLLSSVAVVVTLLLATLVLSLNSFRQTGIVLLSSVQSAGLGLLAVYLFNYPFGFTVIIGLLGVMGLAINAAIVILAELEDVPEGRGMSTTTLVKTVAGCTRHISSTTITTVGGFLPLILAGGGFWPPFAVAIAGGTALTTILSLLWVPVMYRLWLTPPKTFVSDKKAVLTANQS